MSEYLTRDEYRILQADFLPAAREWLFANFVASIHCYRLAQVIAQNFLATLISSSYHDQNRLDEQIEVNADAR
jgi:hypothetical protein